MSDKSPEMTEIKTMWSESLLEHLYLAFKKEKDDAFIQELIVELRAKEYDDEYLINKVTKKVGPTAATRMKALLAGNSVSASADASGEKPLSKADQARANAAKKRAKENTGLVGKIKGIFGGS